MIAGSVQRMYARVPVKNVEADQVTNPGLFEIGAPALH